MHDCLSQASAVRQIAREGERWGLAPVAMPDGSVKVAEIVSVAETRFGVGVVKRQPDRILCTVDEETPFGEVLRNRIDNGETDLARRYKLRDEMEARERRALEAEQERETLRLWSSRRRITALPTGIVPAGLTNRRGRR